MALQAGGDSAGREGAGPGRCLTAETRSISSRWKRLCRPGRQARDRAPGAGQGGQGWARGLGVEQGARRGPGGQARDRGPHLLQPRGLCPCLLPAAQFLGSTPRPAPPSICKSQCLGDSQPPPDPVIPQVHAADSASYWHPNSTWPRGAPQLPLSSRRGPRRPPCFSPERPPPRSGLFTPRCPESPLGLFASHQRCRGQRGHSQHRTPPAQPRLWGTPPPSARGPLRQERGKRTGRGGRLRGGKQVLRAHCVPRPPPPGRRGVAPQGRAGCVSMPSRLPLTLSARTRSALPTFNVDRNTAKRPEWGPSGAGSVLAVRMG